MSSSPDANRPPVWLEEPSSGRAIARGLFKRCPRCGKTIPGWLRLAKRCPRCGLQVERDNGSFLGSLAINYGIAGVAFIAVLIIGVATTAPDVPVGPLLAWSIGVIVASILFFFPISKTLWAAIEYLGFRGEPDYPDLPGGAPPPPDEPSR